MKKTFIRQRKEFPDDERKFYGTNACYALSKQRLEDVQKVYIEKSKREMYFPIIQRAEERKIPVRMVIDADLERLTKSTHHQGICLVAKEKKIPSESEVLRKIEKAKLVVFLDGVENPHNIGAILRTCAHFSVPYVLGPPGLPKLSPAACRTAEGAAEYVDLVALQDPMASIWSLKQAGFRVVGTESKKAASLFRFPVPDKIIVGFGSEVHGLSEEFQELVDDFVQIPGSGAVQSLNVSVSVAIFLSEFSRQLSR